MVKLHEGEVLSSWVMSNCDMIIKEMQLIFFPHQLKIIENAYLTFFHSCVHFPFLYTFVISSKVYLDVAFNYYTLSDESFNKIRSLMTK